MVDELRQAFELAQQQPDEVQRRIAELLRLARATPSADQTRQWWSRVLDLPQGRERWIVVRTAEGEARPGELGEVPLASGQPDLCLSGRCRSGAGQGVSAAARMTPGAVHPPGRAQVCQAGMSTLCLLVYKLAEGRVCQRLAVTGQTVLNQMRKLTAHPTMRWLFQCFEGIDLHLIWIPARTLELPQSLDRIASVLWLLTAESAHQETVSLDVPMGCGTLGCCV